MLTLSKRWIKLDMVFLTITSCIAQTLQVATKACILTHRLCYMYVAQCMSQLRTCSYEGRCTVHVSAVDMLIWGALHSICLSWGHAHMRGAAQNMSQLRTCSYEGHCTVHVSAEDMLIWGALYSTCLSWGHGHMSGAAQYMSQQDMLIWGALYSTCLSWGHAHMGGTVQYMSQLRTCTYEWSCMAMILHTQGWEIYSHNENKRNSAQASVNSIATREHRSRVTGQCYRRSREKRETLQCVNQLYVTECVENDSGHRILFSFQNTDGF